MPFSTIENRAKPKAADWLCFLRTAVPYVFYDVGPQHPRRAFQEMIEALNLLLDVTADYDPADPDVSAATCRAARSKVARALYFLERDFPGTELSIAIHELIHVPDFLLRWNSVRNYWSFVVERLVGFMKTFVKNRSLPVANMVCLLYSSVHSMHAYTICPRYHMLIMLYLKIQARNPNIILCLPCYAPNTISDQ